MGGSVERRMCSRTRFVTNVYIENEFDDIQVEAELQDISIVGMFVHTETELPVNSVCEVKIVIIGNNSTLSLENIKAMVVRNTGNGIALRFISNMEWFVLFKIYTHYSSDGTVGWVDGASDRRRGNDVVSGSVCDRRRT